MTNTTVTTSTANLGGSEALQTEERSALAWAISDTLVLTRRNLLHLVRQPQLLVFTFIQPVMFTLLFRYVFGGAIQTGSVAYVNFLMPGIFVQTVVFGSTATGIGLAEDLATGVVDRFRSLPMSRLAVLAGRTLADLTRNTFVVALMTVIGLLVGFRPSGGITGFALGSIMILLAAFSLSWVFALVGLKAANAEAAQAVAFPLIFPLTFVLGLRAGADDAGLASGLRQAPADHGDHRLGAGSDGRSRRGCGASQAGPAQRRPARRPCWRCCGLQRSWRPPRRRRSAGTAKPPEPRTPRWQLPETRSHRQRLDGSRPDRGQTT